jgi:adenine-specific DNA-methyltransferase
LLVIDTDFDEESFIVRHAYFLGQNDPYKALTTRRGSMKKPGGAYLATPHTPSISQDRQDRGQGDQSPRRRSDEVFRV